MNFFALFAITLVVLQCSLVCNGLENPAQTLKNACLAKAPKGHLFIGNVPEVNPKLNRTKRSTHADFETGRSCEAWGAYYASFDKKLKLPPYDVQEPFLEILYSTINGVNFPTAISAQLLPGHINQSRKDFPQAKWVAKQMAAMDARQRKQKGDEKGHLVGAQLGGQPQWYNLAPQTPGLNRNVGALWPKLENEAKRFLGKRLSDNWFGTGCRRVDWTVVLIYDRQGATFYSRRPLGFKLCATFYNDDGKVVKNINEYFRND